MKKTVVIGVSPNQRRYSNIATLRLLENNHEVVPLGIKNGKIGALDIILERPNLTDVDTVTMYIGKRLQPDWYNYILELNPMRVIFNPGTENGELAQLLLESKIDVVENCTLVMLATNQY
jgi:predicted CoA-binding protein